MVVVFVPRSGNAGLEARAGNRLSHLNPPPGTNGRRDIDLQIGEKLKGRASVLCDAKRPLSKNELRSVADRVGSRAGSRVANSRAGYARRDPARLRRRRHGSEPCSLSRRAQARSGPLVDFLSPRSTALRKTTPAIKFDAAPRFSSGQRRSSPSGATPARWRSQK